MPPNILRRILNQRGEVERIDAANLAEVSRAYARMYNRLEGRIDALRLAIEQMDAPTVAQIRRMHEYRRLMADARTELAQFELYLGTMIEQAAEDGIDTGLRHSAELVSAMTGGPFGGLRGNVVAPLLNYLRRDGPLFERLTQITYATSAGVSDEIIRGIGLGWNPRRIASAIQSAFGGGLTDALRNVRTVQLYSYRDSALANYMTSGVVSGWQWHSSLDSNVCPVCVAQHGTIHPLNERMNGHYNCRCAAVPFIADLSEPIQPGTEWFDNLPPEQQKAMLGEGKYDAFKAGQFKLPDLVGTYESPVYGNMVSEKSLAELIG